MKKLYFLLLLIPVLLLIPLMMKSDRMIEAFGIPGYYISFPEKKGLIEVFNEEEDDV